MPEERVAHARSEGKGAGKGRERSRRFLTRAVRVVLSLLLEEAAPEWRWPACLAHSRGYSLRQVDRGIAGGSSSTSPSTGHLAVIFCDPSRVVGRVAAEGHDV